MHTKNIFLVADSDYFRRKKVLDKLRTLLCKRGNSALSALTVYSKDVDPTALKEVLLSFSFVGRRVVVFKDALKLPHQAKTFIYKEYKKIAACNYLVFEIEEDFMRLKTDRKILKDAFFNYLLAHAQIYGRKNPDACPPSLSMLLGLVRRRKLSDSLDILERLFEDARRTKDTHAALGMQVLGALTREFSYIRNPREKRRCLELLWEAERAVKEGSLNPQLACELLVTKILLH